MKWSFAYLVFALSPLLAAEPLREGDIVFSGSPAGQGQAIMNATDSPHSHCGVVFVENGKEMVLEAVQPVGVVALTDFKARAKPGTFMACRLKAPLSPENLRLARSWAEAQIGKDYDPRFLWGDDRLYCSELVWKIYHHAGVKLCEPRRFQDSRLDDPAVQKIINERFGGAANLPKDEKVVAPSDLAASPLLEKIPSR